jgi:glycosyltransferase involved in cell wall biosynthesis
MNLVQYLVVLLQRLIKRLFLEHVAINVNATQFEKRCLLLYVAHPFLRSHGIYTDGNPFHQNRSQVVLLAKQLGAYGFNVDAVDYDYPGARLSGSYDLLIDVHPGLNPLGAACANRDTRKVFYATGSDNAFSINAERVRLRALAKRRNVVLSPRRQNPPFDGDLLRSYDTMWFLGNKYNLETYGHSRCHNVSYIRNMGYEFPPMGSRDERDAAKKFLFIGSVAQVHKGLDLLLEVFARNRDLTLYVCSKFMWELDFCWCYRKELFHTPNIVPVGFINLLADPRFAELRRKCGFMLLPSCSEANAGSVLAAMSAGLVPIVSRECGFQEDEVNYFEDCSIETIERVIRAYAACDPTWLREQSLKAVNTVRTRYAQENYVQSVSLAIEQLLNPSPTQHRASHVELVRTSV